MFASEKGCEGIGWRVMRSRYSLRLLFWGASMIDAHCKYYGLFLFVSCNRISSSSTTLNLKKILQSFEEDTLACSSYDKCVTTIAWTHYETGRCHDLERHPTWRSADKNFVVTEQEMWNTFIILCPFCDSSQCELVLFWDNSQSLRFLSIGTCKGLEGVFVALQKRLL